MYRSRGVEFRDFVGRAALILELSRHCVGQTIAEPQVPSRIRETGDRNQR
jgi:hypothetical protein